MKANRDPALPPRNTFLLGWFQWYCRRYARKHMHAVRLSKTSVPIEANGEPLILMFNHPGWWDIIVGVLLTERFPKYRFYAPIDEAMLPKYRFFAKLGFFGVDATARGAARFLRTARAIFEQPFGALFITAQGEFVDVRRRPITLRPGLGAVASRLENGRIVPVGVEYTFWEESKPEILLRFGEPLFIEQNPGLKTQEWTTRLEQAMTTNLDILAEEAMSRDRSKFDVLLGGKSGVGGVYDVWRRMKAWARGRKFDPKHGEAE